MICLKQPDGKHYWLSTKLERVIQCMYCGEKKEVEEVAQTPEEESREAE